MVGVGAAGLYSALCLSNYGLRVGLLTKEVCSVSASADSASKWAQGGIAAAVDPQDSPQYHAEDTLRAGAGLCEPGAVALLVKSAPACIQKLEQWGVQFDRHNGKLALTLEAAHSQRRVVHVADSTGKALVTALKTQVLSTPRITVFEQTLVTELMVQGGRCVGLRCLRDGQIMTLTSSAVVLATGGYAQLFAQNTNPPASTGDGVAIAWRSGALVRDLEFVQFHPTALAVKGAPRFLISEAVRGEGAHLVNGRGERFTEELAPRDVVSRAIFRYLLETGEPTVFLDLSPIPPDRIRYRFPTITKVCEQWGIDLFHQPIPVTPAAHYCMGGIATDLWGETTLKGLYAVGETASTGVHGANRLASNSLLECFVFGERLAEHIAQNLTTVPHLPDLPVPVTAPELDPAQLKQALQQLMWTRVGIVRQEQDLATALSQLEQWRSQTAQIGTSDRMAWETRHLLDVAWLMVGSARWRRESRGAHYRQDFPQPDPHWQVHTAWVGDRLFAQPLSTSDENSHP